MHYQMTVIGQVLARRYVGTGTVGVADCFSKRRFSANFCCYYYYFFIPAGSRDPGVKSKVKNRLVELLLLFIIFIIN